MDILPATGSSISLSSDEARISGLLLSFHWMRFLLTLTARFRTIVKSKNRKSGTGCTLPSAIDHIHTFEETINCMQMRLFILTSTASLFVPKNCQTLSPTDNYRSEVRHTSREFCKWNILVLPCARMIIELNDYTYYECSLFIFALQKKKNLTHNRKWCFTYLYQSSAHRNTFYKNKKHISRIYCLYILIYWYRFKKTSNQAKQTRLRPWSWAHKMRPRIAEYP